MNTPSWEAGGRTALVGGNPTERIGRSRVNDMAGKAARVCGRAQWAAADIQRVHPSIILRRLCSYKRVRLEAGLTLFASTEVRAQMTASPQLHDS
jgi:hypothetical protein